MAVVTEEEAIALDDFTSLVLKPALGCTANSVGDYRHIGTPVAYSGFWRVS